jgi:prepilin-type N-terminal cleavage/methylation domain-containing protein/prepilin-type processing-associated H-X9-DG protein
VKREIQVRRCQRCPPQTPAPPRNGSSPGFSLIELLITIAIILVLTTIYFNPSRGNRQQALQAVCQKNLQKVFIALEIYANEHAGRFPFAPGVRTSEEALDALVPRYTSDTCSFICPGSGDSAAPSPESFRKHKISYAYYMGRVLTNSQAPLLSDRQVDTQSRSAGQFAFSTTGRPPGNNHRQFGGNFLFCDGHVQLCPPRVPFALTLDPGESLLNP